MIGISQAPPLIYHLGKNTHPLYIEFLIESGIGNYFLFIHILMTNNGGGTESTWKKLEKGVYGSP